MLGELQDLSLHDKLICVLDSNHASCGRDFSVDDLVPHLCQFHGQGDQHLSRTEAQIVVYQKSSVPMPPDLLRFNLNQRHDPNRQWKNHLQQHYTRQRLDSLPSSGNRAIFFDHQLCHVPDQDDEAGSLGGQRLNET